MMFLKCRPKLTIVDFIQVPYILQIFFFDPLHFSDSIHWNYLILSYIHTMIFDDIKDKEMYIDLTLIISPWSNFTKNQNSKQQIKNQNHDVSKLKDFKDVIQKHFRKIGNQKELFKKNIIRSIFKTCAS